MRHRSLLIGLLGGAALGVALAGTGAIIYALGGGETTPYGLATFAITAGTGALVGTLLTLWFRRSPR